MQLLLEEAGAPELLVACDGPAVRAERDAIDPSKVLSRERMRRRIAAVGSHGIAADDQAAGCRPYRMTHFHLAVTSDEPRQCAPSIPGRSAANRAHIVQNRARDCLLGTTRVRCGRQRRSGRPGYPNP